MRVHGLVAALLMSSQHFVCFLLRMVSCEATKRHSNISHSGSVWAGAFVDVVEWRVKRQDVLFLLLLLE